MAAPIIKGFQNFKKAAGPIIKGFQKHGCTYLKGFLKKKAAAPIVKGF